MCCITDILIYYFSPIFYHPMQDKSNPIHPTHSLQTPHCCSQLEQTPISSLKVAFCQWIRSLPMEQRFLAVKIHVPQAAETVKRIFFKEEHHIKEHTSQQRFQNSPQARRFSRKYEKNFFDSLVLVSDGHQFLDHICFDFAYLECPEKLFELLIGFGDQGSNCPLGSLMKRGRQWKGLNQNLYKMDREQMSYQLFLYIRQEIFTNFNESRSDGELLTKSLEEEKKRKKEFSNHWKFSSEESKQKQLLLGHQDIDQLCQWLAEQSVYIKSNELDKQIQEMLKLQKNDFCNRIFKCKLKKVLSPIMAYYELVYMGWKKEIEKARKKRGIKYNRSDRDYNSQQKIEYIKEGKQYNKQQYKESSKQYKQSGKRKNKKNRKSNSLESNQTNQTQHSITKKPNSQQKIQQYQTQDFQQGSIEMKAKIANIKQQTKQQVNPQSVVLLQYTKKSQSTSSNASTKLSSKQSQQIQIKQTERQYIRRLNMARLNDELQEISDKISQQANQFHDRRVIAFQRIQFLLQYYSVPIKLFGSCASGIAVRNSDIDIAIDNSILMYMDYLPENERIRAALLNLQELFVTQAWITQIKFIKTAAIPLIKLTINTQLPFFDPSIGTIYYQLNRQHNWGPINADITVETKNKSEQCSHLGLISTNAINKWLAEISCLHSIIIIMKEMFVRKKLNCTYEGGLNTFSMIVLMVAYIYHAKLEKQQNAAEVFQKILKFYSQEFNQVEKGVDLLNRETNNIFYIKNIVNIEASSKQKADLQIKDPMNQQRNMTRNCYSFPQIKRLFQLMMEYCFTRGEKQLDHLLSNGKREQQLLNAYGSRNVFIDFLSSMDNLF